MSKFSLIEENIDKASDEIGKFLSAAGVNSGSIIKIKLTAEEALINYMNRFGGDREFELKCVRLLGRVRVEIRLAGESMNPFEAQWESEVLQGILSRMGTSPTWQYRNGVNLIVFTPKKKKLSPLIPLAVSILSAVVLGFLCSLIPGGFGQSFSSEIITPVFDACMGLLSAIAGPLIFLSVIWGIYSIGDTATLGKIGKRMISRFISMTFLLTSVFALCVSPLFDIRIAAEGISGLSNVFGIVLDMVPGNFFSPFAEGNTLNIIFIAVLIGIALLILGNKVSLLCSLTEQANTLVHTVMEWISSLIPAFVFLSIFNIMIRKNFAMFLDAYKAPLLVIIGTLSASAVYIVLICARKKVSPALLLRKIAPTFLICLTTASSSAAFSSNMECCEKRLGIDKRIVLFGVPLGQVLFMPAGAIVYFTACICMAELYGVQISVIWVVTAVLISSILSIATPPIPGGGVACYTVMFLQLNIPSEALAFAIAMEIIADFFVTASNVFCLQADLVELAGSLDMLDRAKLKSPSNT